MALAVAEAAAAAGLRIVLLPAAYHRGGHARLPRRDRSTRSSRASTRCGWRGARGRRRRAQRPRRAGGLAARDRRATPTTHGLVRHVHAHEQPRELEECRAEHGCSPIELLDRTGFLGRPHDGRARHPRHRPRRRAAGRRPARSSRPARPPRATSATATSRRCATATPACGWRSAATATSSSTRSRRCASWRPARAASAAPATRCSPRPATCGARWRANGRASLGLEDAGDGDDRPRPPAAARRRGRGRHARASPPARRRVRWSP